MPLKVRVHANPERDKAYPGQREPRRPSKPRIRSYTHEVLYPKGEPENPLSDNELTFKFEKNASALYAMDRVNKIRDVISDMENRDVREMTSMLKAP